MRRPGDKLNILTFATHERYEENLCRTGHNFYSLKDGGKEWDTTYAPVPKNYYILDELPEWLDIDLVLGHTSCNRLQLAHDILSQTVGSVNQISVPMIRHCHVLPDIRYDVKEQTEGYRQIPVDVNSFISDFNRAQWGYTEDNSFVIPHGVDTEFWNIDKYGTTEHPPFCFNAVNYFPDRDWCCGFNLWQRVTQNLPALVRGKSTNNTFSEPAKNKEELRYCYQQARLFLNTSLHSPIPTVMLEAMACGCPVVSTETCMIPEVIEHGVNGFMSNDPEELRAYCIKLLEDKDLAVKMGNAARTTIEEKYNLDNFVSNWNNLINKSIGEFEC
jgi:glycosyltransferase involved in cell wall biosynthesis